MKTILTWGIALLLLGFALRARGQEIVATFYPGCCVNYVRSVTLLNAPDLRNVPRTALLPADCSEREARTVRRMLEADQDPLLSVAIDGARFAELNQSGASMLHVFAPNGARLSTQYLGGAAQTHSLWRLLVYAKPSLPERFALPDSLDLLGWTNLSAKGNLLHLYCYALNTRHDYDLESGRLESHDADATPNRRRVYAAWNGDTTGWQEYEAEADGIVKLLGMPPLQYDGVSQLDWSGGWLLKHHLPRKIMHEGKTTTAWTPETLIETPAGDSTRLWPLKRWNAGTAKNERWPASFVYVSGDTAHMIAEADAMHVKSPFHVRYLMQPDGRLKPVSGRAPRIPAEVCGPNWLWQAHGPLLVFEKGWVYDLKQQAWRQLALPADSSRLLDVRPLGWHYEGLLVGPDDSLRLGVWNAAGKSLTEWPLGVSVAGRKSNLWIEGQYVYWLDERQDLVRVRIRD